MTFRPVAFRQSLLVPIVSKRITDAPTPRDLLRSWRHRVAEYEASRAVRIVRAERYLNERATREDR